MDEVTDSLELLQSLKEVKEEAPDDDDYSWPGAEEIENLSELLEPKLEEPDDFEMDRPFSIEHSIGEVQLEREDYGHLEPETETDTENIREHPKRTRANRKCFVCSDYTQQITQLVAKNRIMILAIGCVLGGQKTIEEAQLLASTSRFYTCQIHLSETIDSIYNALNIKNAEEMQMCSIENHETFMIIVNLLCPESNFTQFCNSFIDFMRKFNLLSGKSMEPPIRGPPERKRKMIETFKPTESGGPVYTKTGKRCFGRHRTSTTDPNSRQRTRRCTICSQLKNSGEQVHIVSKDRKLVLLVGCVLGGKKTIEEAQLVFSSLERFYICKTHFPEAIDEILKVLNIQNTVEMQSCSIDNKEYLMLIVNTLCPESSFAHFSELLEDFVQKVAHMNNC